MPLLRDIPCLPAAADLLEAAGRGRPDPPPVLREGAERALRLARPLLAPAAVYARLPLRGVTGGRVELDAGALNVGPRVDLLASARQLFLAAYTIGPALETRVAELRAAGDLLLAYLLDCLGVLALELVGAHLGRLAEGWAAERGWGLSPALSPGSLEGWPLEGQRELAALLPLDEIGLALNERCVLLPYKSVSLVIGLGPGYGAHQVGSLCAFCALRERCWLRRE